MLIKKNIKKVICDNWKKGICKYNKEKCNFAHGENDLIKQECSNGINCYNENCWFKHPDEWRPYDNKKECIFCAEGFCDKKNNKYKHINDDIIDTNIDVFKNVKNNEKLNVIKEIDFNDEDFPILNNNIKDNKTSYDGNDIKVIKEELYKEYKYLSQLNPNESWANEDIVEETNERIEILTNKYNVLKDITKDILDEELNLRLLENNSDNKNENIFKSVNTGEHSIPNVNISIKYNDEENEDDNILSIINEMEEKNKNHIKRIKIILDKKEKTINDENKIYLKLQINKIMKDINLFKLNYEDLII